tara:strand:+ start:1604 stop:1900 length:297 start_codon:yes stop_codon:yes gene_type:complete
MSESTDKLILEQLVRVNEKLGKSNEVSVDVRNLTTNVLAVKERHHRDWMTATARRFYVSLVTVVLMGSAFYVDIILDGKPSTFLNTILRWLDFGSAIL